jgi:hypothetical protein
LINPNKLFFERIRPNISSVLVVLVVLLTA